MKHINLLIIASSDMDGTLDNYNLPSDVINVAFPCSKYDGKTTKNKFLRCKKCNYTELEHNNGYPLFPLHPTKSIIGNFLGTSDKVYGYSEYSDFWKNKYVVFERIKIMFGNNISINYQTITPNYVNNLEYLPVINKINNIVSKKLKLKGRITYKKPYHYSCDLDEIYNEPSYKDTKASKYDCIFVVGGGIGWLYTPENFKIMTNLLSDKSKVAIIGNLWYKPELEYPEYHGRYKFMNPINSCLNNNSIQLNNNISIKECIRNYTDILLNNDNFIESYEMLFRVSK